MATTEARDALHRSLMALRLEVPAAVADDVAKHVAAAIAEVAADTHPTGLIGIADEYGTIWSGEPGASIRIGDLVQRSDEETMEVRLGV